MGTQTRSTHTPLVPAYTPALSIIRPSHSQPGDILIFHTLPSEYLSRSQSPPTTTMQRFTIITVLLLLLCSVLISLATAGEADSHHIRVTRKAKCEITPQCEARCKYCGGGDKKCPASGICGGGYTCKGKAVCEGKECTCKKT